MRTIIDAFYTLLKWHRKCTFVNICQSVLSLTFLESLSLIYVFVVTANAILNDKS